MRGRDGEVNYPTAIESALRHEQVIEKPGRRREEAAVCYEARRTGHGLARTTGRYITHALYGRGTVHANSRHGMNNLRNEFDFAVIGGGLVGAAIAWGLSGPGRRVGVLDEGDIAYRASRANFGLVWVQGKGGGIPQYAIWTRQSVDLWPRFAEELRAESGIDVCFRQPGGLHLMFTEREIEKRADAFKRLRNGSGPASFEYRILDRTATERMLPQIGPEVAGASFCPLDGHVNVLRLLHALHLALQRRGGSYFSDHAVRKVEPVGGGFRLHTADKQIATGKVVLAAGLDNARLAPMVGLDAPVRPQRGQIMVTERVASFLPYIVQTVWQTSDGNVMIGDSVEEAGFDTSVDSKVLAVMANRALKMFPLLGTLNVLRSWAALRVMPRDGYPIYDQSEAFPGAYLATCHSGVTLTPAHAILLPALVDNSNLRNGSLETLSARRFHVSTSH